MHYVGENRQTDRYDRYGSRLPWSDSVLGNGWDRYADRYDGVTGGLIDA